MHAATTQTKPIPRATSGIVNISFKMKQHKRGARLIRKALRKSKDPEEVAALLAGEDPKLARLLLSEALVSVTLRAEAAEAMVKSTRFELKSAALSLVSLQKKWRTTRCQLKRYMHKKA